MRFPSVTLVPRALSIINVNYSLVLFLLRFPSEVRFKVWAQCLTVKEPVLFLLRLQAEIAF